MNLDRLPRAVGLLPYLFFLSTDMTKIKELAKMYYHHHESLNRSPATVKWHKTVHRLFFEQCKINEPEDFTREAVRNFMYQGAKKELSPTTIRTYIRSLKAFSNWLFLEEYIEKNAFQKKLDLPTVEKKKCKLIPKNDLKKITKAINVYPDYKNTLERLRTKALFLIYANVGLRKSEALNIEMKNVFLEKGLIYIEKTKTRNWRNVVINKKLAAALNDYLDYLNEHKIKSKYLFFVSHPSFAMSDSYLKRMVRKIEIFARKRYKIKHFTLHMFRHSYISYGLAAGIPLTHIMTQVGHESFKTTEGYNHTPLDEMVNSLVSYSMY